MARARRKQASQFIDDVPSPRAKAMPDVCPLCEVSYGAEISTHLLSHAPVELCQRCDEQDKSWRLDEDGVQYFRKDVSLFYCRGCGRYAPLEIIPES
jgi:hypothetical protein